MNEIMTIDQYILYKKRKAYINEFDISKRKENTRQIIDYVFDYFNVYLDKRIPNKEMKKDDSSTEKYRKGISNYSDDVAKRLG